MVAALEFMIAREIERGEAMRTVQFALAVILLAGVATPLWLPAQELGPRTCVEDQERPQDCR
jgi:hypothetical protein